MGTVPENEDQVTKLSSCAEPDFACKIYPTQFSARFYPDPASSVSWVDARSFERALLDLWRERFCGDVVG
jgi:hypothetical protein